MKIHIGCGSVYLKGWGNVDVRGAKTFLAADRPDLVKKYETEECNYFARHQAVTVESLAAGPLDQEYVCDFYGDFENLPGSYWNSDEVLARHSFEHLSITEAHRALDSIDSIMASGGILRLDVPDHSETLRLYRESGDPFYVRHLLGPRRNEFGFHMMSYTPDRLRALVESHGFLYVGEEANIHVYPAFCLRFVKPGPRTPRDYAYPPSFGICDEWRVLDLGPGEFPLPRANAYLDRHEASLERFRVQGKQTIAGDLMTGLPQVPSKSFDYVFCSHVLEHVEDPEMAAATISRIGKRGTIVLPSVIKESIGNFEEAEHQWLIFPSPVEGGPPVFVRHNPEYIRRIRDTDVQKITSRLFRTGPNRIDPEQRHLRSWFYRNEPNLDVIVHWEDEFKIQVVR